MILPHDSRLEKTVLASMILSEKALIQATDILLDGACFYHEENKTAYKAILAILKAGGIVSALSVDREISKSSNRLNEANNLVSEIISGMIVADSEIKGHCEHLIELYKKRLLLSNLAEYGKRAQSNEHLSEDIFCSLESSISDIRKCDIKTPCRSLSESSLEYVTEFEKQYKNQIDECTKTGFDKIDRVTSGLPNGKLIVIGGRPGMGKTSLATELVINALADDNSKPVLFFSIEMGEFEIRDKIISSLSGVPIIKKRNRQMSKTEMSLWGSCIHSTSSYNLYVDCSKNITPMKIRARAKSLKYKCGGLKMVVVDYLQLMYDDQRHRDIRLMITEISKSMAHIAGELDVPVLLLSQLSRSAVNRSSGTTVSPPRISDLRESGGIEDNAYMVILIHRPCYYNKDEKPGIAEIEIAKNRGGPIGVFDVGFNGPTTKFYNLSENPNYED